MKKYVLLIIAFSVIVFQSCKKDEFTNPDRTSRTSKVYNTESSSFNPRAIDDMDSYLTNFLKEIKSPTRDAQPMSVEDAQWHLSACLNFQFCNANVEKTQVVYDTIYTTICVDNGYVSLNDINTSLQEISTEVIDMYKSCDLENKNILFIAPIIQDESLRSGSTIRTVVAISNNTEYYYLDEYDVIITLDSIIPDDCSYPWDSEAIDVLKYLINYYKPTRSTDPSQRSYYVVTHTIRPSYTDVTLSNRIYWNNYSSHLNFNKELIIYYLDSYLGLIEELNPSYPENHSDFYEGLVVPYRYSYISIDIAPNTQRESMVYYHMLSINYGEIYVTQTPQIPLD